MKIPICTWLFLMPFLVISFGDDVVSGKCGIDQQSLLLQLKKSLVFDQSASVKLARWGSSTDCCKWAGITCDDGGRGRVISLDLSNESINGGLDNSSSLFNLQFLQSLNLSLNNFKTTLPTRFASLTDLASLTLSNAGFVGQIPIQIASLTKLVSLDLSTSYTTGNRSLKLENPNLAALVQYLTELTELRLDGVNISAHGNEWCQALASSLPKLQVLSFSNCFLSGPIDSSLGKLRSLSVINLGGNNISAPVPDFFANFTNLSALHLSSCQLNGTFPVQVFELPTLEIVDLSTNRLLQGSLPELSQNHSLQTLVLSSAQFSGKLPKSMGDLAQLVYLDLSMNIFTGPIPSFRMSNSLTYVDLSHNQLTGEISSTNWKGLTNLVYLDLQNNSLNGTIPWSLFAISSLQKIQLSINQFWGQVPEFSNVSSSLLDTLDLRSNSLEGYIPMSFFNLKRLNVLSLSSNKFNGTVQLDWIQKLGNLSKLDLSFNNLTVISPSNSTLSPFPKISTLRLASCNLRMFPYISNQSRLFNLDLSDNQIRGMVPGWISAVGDGSLQYLNLSRNLLVGLEPSFSSPNSLSILDLHDNLLQGNIPTLPPSITYVDLSSNKFNSFIPANIGNYLNFTFFLSLSSNNLKGAIPQSICNASWLQVLDLSNNKLSGTIPACLIERIETLRVLNLRRNSFNGNIPENFSSSCQLKTLDLSGNNIQGQVPESLANCKMLEVLDIGNNQINDTFPCLLKSISSFRVLVLRHNMFHGQIGCLKNNATWPRLQIVDLASNKFSGNLPPLCLNTWEAMKGDENQRHDHIRFEPLMLTPGMYYQDSVTVTIKGLEMELVKILTVFTSIDFSNNKFEGSIPDVIGQFNALYVLNLSHNALTGPIPSALGNLLQLESLDLSVNHLSGLIPSELTKLTFLSVLNLSDNNLVGLIPKGSQFQTFSNDSFQRNDGLCGHPLTKLCSTTNASNTIWISYRRKEFDWKFIVPGLGYGLGAGIAVAPILLNKEVNKWYDDRIDRILSVLFPMLGLRYYKSGDWRIEPQESSDEEDNTDIDDEEDEVEDQENEEYLFRGRYCVFCTKLDITRKRVIHDLKCTCYQSPPISSPSSSSSSYSSSSPF